MRSMVVSSLIAITALIGAVPDTAQADTYTEATFSGQIAPGNANVQAPFSGNGFTQGDPFSGTFVFDNQKVPTGTPGFANVPFASFPDSANIPAASAFGFNLDGLSFNLANNIDSDLPGAILYNNGQFDGFEFISNFNFGNNQYQFRMDGSVITVNLLDSSGNPTGSSLINAFINVGNGNLSHETPFTPVSNTPVPLPGTLGLLALALSGGVTLVRRRKTGEHGPALAC